ncbi:MAG: UvrD-helicase domain-containing protein [Melioribacteraceae bacterium]|nr:UvrD-helicase domain-containing protein [Melioribacteraceae bacterium]
MGYDPQSILLLTFTRKAAREMMNRAAILLDNRCSKINGGTFHSFANLTLRKYC